jgi:exoribonuclease R
MACCLTCASCCALEELDTLARHCTEQQGNADKVERSVRKSAAALLLAPRIGQRFDAIVTGAADKGTWVQVGLDVRGANPHSWP